MKQGYIYILTNQKHGTLYVGVTSNLVRRIYQHRTAAVEGFTKTYGLKTLVYFEVHEEISEAISREKRLKKWRRDWKIALIEKENPEWRDLYPGLL